jgi:hypothetical protein
MTDKSLLLCDVRIGKAILDVKGNYHRGIITIVMNLDEPPLTYKAPFRPVPKPTHNMVLSINIICFLSSKNEEVIWGAMTLYTKISIKSGR